MMNRRMFLGSFVAVLATPPPRRRVYSFLWERSLVEPVFAGVDLSEGCDQTVVGMVDDSGVITLDAIINATKLLEQMNVPTIADGRYRLYY